MEEKDDHLSLASNALVEKMLTKEAPKGSTKRETVIFSDWVTKINKRGKKQTRVLLITDHGLYNLLPDNYGKCKRRIDVSAISGVTVSKVSDEFVVHVAEEYDYHFESKKKKRVAQVLKTTYSQLEKKADMPAKLPVVEIEQSELKEMATTKAMARMQSREDAFKKRKQLAAQAHDSDKDEQDDAKQDDELEEKDNVFQMVNHKSGKCRLEDFELLKVLGRGSFGKVMLVRKKGDPTLYAMKILKKKAIIARNQVEHTKAERKILEELQHPFLMTLRYAFQSKEKLYFVLDYYQGGELFFHLKAKRRFPEDVARLYVAEIGSALGHLHSLGVVYRDLKPENILLDDNGHVCLTDFGLSKDVSDDEAAHTFCGTPEYLAPEIVSGVGHNKAVDWWSLGILLYELTVGIPPFYSQNVNEMYNKIQHGVLRFPPFLSEDCKSLIVQLLNRDPTKRLGSGKDLDDIKAHPFFKPLDWNKLMRKEIESPYKPKIKDAKDTSNFDDTFTNEPVVDSYQQDSQLSQTLAKQDNFGGFTFVNKPGHM